MFAFQCYPFGIPKLGRGVHKGRVKRMTIRAGESTSPNLEPVGPLNLESPVGQLLERVLQTHPHLLPATVDQQLENLQKIRDAEAKESATSSQDNLLYKRIAEVKEKERRKAVEEILYCLAVHKFVENGISMIPKIKPTSDPTGRVDFWPNQEQKLVSIHSTEALEVIQSHLSIVLGERYVGPLQNMVEIGKIKLGKLYAASIIYGYFIRRVDQRYQLEKSMNTLPKDFVENRFRDSEGKRQLWDPESMIQIPSTEFGDGFEGEMVESSDDDSYRLKSYVMHLDAETLQRYAVMRSKEAISLIEKQTQALFGKPEIKLTDDGSLETQNDEVVVISFSGMGLLILEAVAFGSFLWEAEDYVESRYNFIKS
ncbi:UV-B-induced protein, chloroplastic-like protein [Drosera capensis]